MAKGYWMFHVTVNDPDTYQKYIEHDAPVFAKYGGRFLARGGEFQALEGTARQRHVIIEFDSYETALAYYHSPDYQAAAAFRRRSAIADLVIVKGVE